MEQFRDMYGKGGNISPPQCMIYLGKWLCKQLIAAMFGF
jgi:hypothetical protein